MTYPCSMTAWRSRFVFVKVIGFRATSEWDVWTNLLAQFKYKQWELWQYIYVMYYFVLSIAEITADVWLLIPSELRTRRSNLRTRSKMISNCSDGTFAKEISPAAQQVFIVCLGFLSVIGCFGNALVMICIITSKKLQTSTNCFIINLSIADMLVCGICMPVEIYYIAYRDCGIAVSSSKLCVATGILVVGLCTVSIVSLAWISLNRYLLIVHGSTTYRKIFNRRCIPLMIGCSWLWGCNVLIPPLFGYGGLGYNIGKGFCDFDTSLSTSFYYMIYVLCFSVGIPLITTFLCYLKIFFKVRHSRLRVRQHAFVRNRKEERKKKDLKLTKDLSIIFCIFCFCASPYTLAEVIDHGYELFAMELHIFGSVLIVSNSVWNPFVYTWRSRDFRNAMKRVTSLRIFNESSRDQESSIHITWEYGTQKELTF